MDLEIQAMGKISEALNGVDDETRARILRWAADKYSVKIKGISTSNENNGDMEEDDKSPNGSGNENFETFAELFGKVNPKEASQKLLVAAYWHQVILKETELDSKSLNNDLKDLGHGITDVSKKFNTLINQEPKLALQLKKTGTTKQGRKRFKLTKAGIDKINNALK